MAREGDSQQADEQPSSMEPIANSGLLAKRASIGSRAGSKSSYPIAAAIGAVGITLVGGILGSIFKRNSSKKKPITIKSGEKAPPSVDAAVEAPAATPPATNPATEMQNSGTTMDEVEAAAARDTATAAVGAQGPVAGVDLSPFGSPVGNTPVRMPPMKAAGRSASIASNDGDDASDNASVRDQRSSLVDAAQLQKTLKQMQEMAEENRKLSQFLSEYKMDAEKLSKLEQENQALRDVTKQLELELQDLKVNTLPRTGAELEIFKKNVNVSAVARSVCSNDETVALGVSTASVDGTNPDARMRRHNVFKQLLSHLQGGPSTGTSQPTTPRSVSGGGGAPSMDGTGSRQRKQPRPEEAAAIGQAVYQLLDSFGGRMM